jgi:hypothetical protein
MLVRPGGIFSATVALHTVRNYPPTQLRDRLILPAGWFALSPGGDPFVPAKDEEIRLVAVPVPRGAPAGEYKIYYVVSSVADPSIELAREPLTVTVPIVSALLIVAETAPEQVVAGDSYSVVWRLINHGNNGVKVDLRARSSQGYKVSINPTQLALNPGENALVWTVAKTPGDLRFEEMNGILLDSEQVGLGDRGRQTEAAYSRILPHFTSPSAAGDDFVATLTNSGAYRDEGGRQSYGTQTELSGEGYLDNDRTRQLQFLVLTAPTGTQTGLLPHDQYTVDYTSRRWDLLLGDNLFSLSPLTERWLYGRGVEVDYKERSAAAGGYYAYTPWESVDVRQLGLFAQFSPLPDLLLRSNFLFEETSATETWIDPRSFLPSLQIFLQPAKSTTLELEGALSDNSEMSTGDAFRATLKGELGKSVFYDFERIYASPDYFGYYSDFASTSGTVAWRIDSDWRLRASYEDADSNLERDPLRGSALELDDQTVGVDRTITPNFQVSLNHHYTSYADRLADGQPTFEQDTFALSGTWTSPLYSIRAAVEEGDRQIDAQPRQNLGYDSVSIFGVVRPKPNITLSLLVSDGDSPYTAEPLREFVETGAAQVNFSNGFRLRAAVSATQSRDPPRSTRQTTLDMVAGYEFHNGMDVEMGIHSSSTTGSGPDRGAFVSWSIPLPVQLLRKRAYGSLAGSVRLRQGDASKPLAGVILHLDKLIAVSDHEGHFAFPLAKPGRLELTVEPVSLGPGIILNESGPDLVELVRGQRLERQLEAVRASRIEGEVELFDEAPPDYSDLRADVQSGARQSGTVGHVLVELRKGSAVHRTESDDRGYFSFDRLLPGEWTVTIDGHNLPERHKLDRQEFVVELAAGSVEHLEARVLPVHRPVKIIDSGWLSSISAASPR